MSLTYHERKAAGLCPVCGGVRHGELIVCFNCRVRMHGPQYAKDRPERYRKHPTWFIGLHELLCAGGKREPKKAQDDYSI